MSSDCHLKLGDFVSLQRGTTYKGALLGLPDPVLLGLASIQPNGGFRQGAFKTYGGESPEKITLRSGEIYVSLKDVTQSGDLLGSVARLPKNIEKGRLTQDTVKLVFDGKPISAAYIYWLLRTPEYREYCRARGTGTTTLGLSREDFLNFKAPLPTEAESSLVELLEAVETRIELLKETNVSLEAISQALFKSWFVDFDPVRAKAEGLEPEGMDASTAAFFPDRFEESEVGLVPNGWTIKSVDDVAEVIKGKSYKSSELATSHHTALVTLKSFSRGGGFRLDGFKPYTGSYKSAQVIVSGDLIIAYTDVTQAAELIGKPAIVVGVEDYQTLVASLDVGIVKPKTLMVSRQYLYGLFRTDLFQNHTLAHTSGTTVLHLAKNAVGSYKFASPPQELLQIFSAVTDTLFERCQKNIDQIRTLTQLRDTLLPRLISGQLRLPEAEVVVEEICA